jgi:hypothetical protein
VERKEATLITTNDVYELVYKSDSIVKEIFSSVVGSKSKATRTAAVAQVEVYCKEVLRVHPEWAPITKGTSSLQSLLELFTVAEIVALIDAADSRLHSSVFNKIVNASSMLRILMIRLGAFVYDLDSSRLIELDASDKDKYKAVGLGIVLSGLYLSMADQNQ